MRPSLAFASAASLVLARLATATSTVAANDTSLAERDIPLISGLTAALTAGVCLDVGFGVGLVTAPIVAGVDLDVCLCVNLDAALSLSKRGHQTPRVRPTLRLHLLTSSALPGMPGWADDQVQPRNAPPTELDLRLHAVHDLRPDVPTYLPARHDCRASASSHDRADLAGQREPSLHLPGRQADDRRRSLRQQLPGQQQLRARDGSPAPC